MESLKNLKNSSILNLNATTRCDLIIKIAQQISKNSNEIIKANLLDLEQNANLSSSIKDRLLLDEKRINSLSQSLEEIANLPEVLGIVHKGWIAKSGIKIQKISVPIGNIAVIYESRPNITAEIAALCIKSGNACALKGGKEAKNTNLAIMKCIKKAFEEFNINCDCVVYLDISRDEIVNLVKMDKYLDLIVPRGGSNLIKFVCENATVPVLKHDKGICHIFVDKDADLNKALDICINAKCSRPSTCNTAETILIHKNIAKEFLPNLKAGLDKFNTQIFGCENTAKFIPCEIANDENFATEYLDYKVNIKIVADLDEAIWHIGKFGSGHSEAVVSENYSVCEKFLSQIDSSCVFANTSTRFNDGGEFGFGAEIGISTNKLHARGPVGLAELTTYKYIIRGNGQIR